MPHEMHPKERGHVVTREWEDRTLKRDSFGSSLSLLTPAL